MRLLTTASSVISCAQPSAVEVMEIVRGVRRGPPEGAFPVTRFASTAGIIHFLDNLHKPQIISTIPHLRDCHPISADCRFLGT